MVIRSPIFEPNGLIPLQYTCDGVNDNPPLVFTEVPDDTQSLVLIMDDPDVPVTIRANGIWDHWLAWNIPPYVRTVREGEEPPGIIGKNTGGGFGYSGPCPPDREHRYFFKLYALDSMLNLDPATCSKGDLEAAMQGHLVAQAKLVGRYARGIFGT